MCLHFCEWFAAEDEQFEADKAQVVREIAALEPKELSWAKKLHLYVEYLEFVTLFYCEF